MVALASRFKMAAKAFILYALAASIRGYFMLNSIQIPWNSSGIGITTPHNSWKRVLEGIYLYRKGVSPYSGGIFHETPLLLVFFEFMTRNYATLVPVTFVACDMCTAFILSRTANRYIRHMLTKESRNRSKYASDSEKLLLKESDMSEISLYVAIVYLFHPYSIASCSAQTTTTIANVVIAFIAYFTVTGKLIAASIFLALATFHSFYPAALCLPCAMHISQIKSQSDSKCSWSSVALVFAMFAASLIGLFFASYLLLQSWSFLYGIYGFLLLVEDLTPNIGLFWYFFTEMFGHFRNFFICTFQINAFLYIIPLVIRFRNDLFFVAFIQLGLMAVFKSYPNVGDIALYMSLIPIWLHLYPYMRQTFLIGCIFGATTVLGPVLYHMWIYAGSANANFFFGTTLALNTAQIFLVSDILFAYIKRDYHLMNGVNMNVDGKLKKLALQ